VHPSLSPLEAHWRAWTRALSPTYVTADDGQAIPGHLRSALPSLRVETSNASSAYASTPSANKSALQKMCKKPRH
jgi:hypothetical protein